MNLTTSTLALFAAVLALACSTPGPTTLALVARVLGHGLAGVPLLCLGLLLGELVWLAGAVAGLAALADMFEPVLQALKYGGAAYLLYLAVACWRAPVQRPAPAAVAGDGAQLLMTGVAMALGNPKTMLFYLALLPGLVPLSSLNALDLVALTATVAIVCGATLAAYAFAATRVRRLLQSPQRHRALNRGSAVMMGGAAVAVAAQ